MKLLDLFASQSDLAQWQRQLNQRRRQLIMGVSGTAKAAVMASALEEVAGKILIVTSTQNEAEQLVADLSSLVGEEKVYNFFTDDIAAAEFIFASPDKLRSRIASLNFLQDQTAPGFLVASLAATRVHLPSPSAYQSARFQLSLGQELAPDQLAKQLMNAGYKRTSRVLTQGEFSLRGDILDLYDFESDLPYRLEFFGDEIDGLRTFDIEKQTSLDTLDRIQLSPADDIILTAADFGRAESRLQEAIEKHSDETLRSYLKEVLADVKVQDRHPDLRKFLSFFYEESWTLLDYLPKQAQIFFDDFQKILDANAKFDLDMAETLTLDLQNGKAVSSLVYFASTYQTLRQYKPATFFSTFQKGLGNLRFDQLYQLNQHSMQEFFSQIPLLQEELTRFEKLGYTVLIQAETVQSLQSLQKTLQDYGLTYSVTGLERIQAGQIQLVLGQLSAGFNFIDQKIVLITEKEIFNKKIKKRIRRQHATNAERLKDYNELEVGDYVVHQVHGIGKYLGIETIEISGVHRDYLTIQYDQGDRISLPVDQLDLLSKYMASDGKTPKINKLNDGRFQRTRQKVQRQVADIADDLIKLYAERSQLKGFAFSPDDANQRDFDESFAYAETDDQLRSIDEVKRDMGSDRPMDRLLVGDVGFGKTEVAMRAAFKAVNDHKQVAILVPTTVLAQQHYSNFVARFAEFPVNVDVLSRFRTKAEQAATLDKLKKGQVDIIIGTHRLLSQDITFADLGLIIIDEEQRFGVKHKETLKTLKKKVDVLTLTATPIPRTLHMSMLGIRDLSVIETPPTNRYPVQTYVMETNPTVIREAIMRELDRGGQVYYLYNRVDTIEQKVSELRELVPEANISFVHGQMSEIQLENALLDFVNGEFDVLVTTTIIETGVDIPNANTLFIENADNMGLSTLYQLRGRVGRSSRIAYAYLMYRPDKNLTEVSEKRLAAIKGFTELGSGFKIAMQDLSIRGAGNLLGASQSGFIDSVGYELYAQLLEEAILQKQGKDLRRRKSNTEIQLQIDAYLPSDYIDDERQKIEIYKRIRELDSRVNYQHLQDELIDRFGEYPDVVAYLLEIGLLKAFMDQVLVKLVLRRADVVTVSFEAAAQQLYLTQDYFQALAQTQLKARISENKGRMEVIFDVRGKKDYQILEGLMTFAETLLAMKQAKETRLG